MQHFHVQPILGPAKWHDDSLHLMNKKYDILPKSSSKNGLSLATYCSPGYTPAQ